MQHTKQTIQLSDHIKNKLRQHQPTPFSLSSGDLTISDNSDDDDVASTPEETTLRRRSSTFITYELRSPSKAQSLYSLKPNSVLKTSKPICQECHRRERLLRNEHERLLHVYNENQKLNEQLRSATIANQQFQQENAKLKLHLTKVNTHLKEYQANFDLLKQQLASEKNTKYKSNLPKQSTDQLKRLRHELDTYNEIVAAKQQQEEQEVDYYSYRKWTPRK